MKVTYRDYKSNNGIRTLECDSVTFYNGVAFLEDETKDSDSAVLIDTYLIESIE